MKIIKRKLISQLTDWYKQGDRKPLLIRGARQVGKSWAVSEWAKKESLELLTINFEEQPQYISIFEKDLNVNRIIDEISAISGTALRNEKVVLFLDEIQKAPKAITALRYFYEKANDINVVAAGSLVEFVLEEQGLPVGRVQSLFVFPLTFTEFLYATGKNGLAEILDSFVFKETVRPNDKIAPVVHDELLSSLRLYFRIGGMPKVLSRYIETRDIIKASEEQSILIQGYADDFRKYAKKNDWVLLETIFRQMGQLAGGGQVKFSSIDSQSKSVQVRRALLALSHALIIHKILPTTADKLPLAAHAMDKRFKLAFLDIGLLHRILGFDWSNIDQNADLTDIAQGRFAEQFVAQEIIAARSNLERYALHYWHRLQPGSEAEVDFITEFNNRPVPIEVKSSPKGKLRSLDLYINQYESENALVLSQRNTEQMGKIQFLPLYFAAKI